MKTILKALAAFAAAVAASTADATYTDLWSNPQESGWGANVVQQDETAFVTLHVYGPDGRPTWYVGPDARVVAYSGSGGFPIFRGTLYRTEGPWHGGSFDPGAVTVVPIGEISLEVIARDRMRLHYSAEGVSVVKEVRRQSFAEPVVAASYVSQFVLRVARPGEAPFGTSRYQADILLHFEAGEGFMRTDDHLGRRCEYRGPYRQTGKLLHFSGAFVCSAGEAVAGTFELSDLVLSAHGVTGYLRKDSQEVKEYGRFAAARY